MRSLSIVLKVRACSLLSNVSVTARLNKSSYRIAMTLAGSTFNIKLDTGANSTVISAKSIDRVLSEADMKTIEAWCISEGAPKYKFLSATGDDLIGYGMVAHNVKLGAAIFQNFHFYLVLGNKRNIALLGVDFISKCEGSFTPDGDIVITGFDRDNYGKIDGALEAEELIAFIDSLTEE